MKNVLQKMVILRQYVFSYSLFLSLVKSKNMVVDIWLTAKQMQLTGFLNICANHHHFQRKYPKSFSITDFWHVLQVVHKCTRRFYAK